MSECPFHAETSPATGEPAIADWWPNQLDLAPLNAPSPTSDPNGPEFDYSAEFATIDLDELAKDVAAVMTDSQDWWPADYGHYGPFFIRMAWHSAGTYRIGDGRGGAGAGMLRFAPLNSWPDNGNLDKARRLLWPVKQKYGRKLSWADLMIFTGNIALETMGLKTFGFAGGRADVYEPEDIYWGPEGEWLADERYRGDRELMEPLGAVQMGLIYVNPEGPNGNGDPAASARDIRETFARMAMNDEETVALIAGGHTFGKGHGAGNPELVGPEPEAADLTEQGFGWTSTHGSGKAEDTITSGLEGAWTATPTTWDNSYFDTLFGNEWEQAQTPAGAWLWQPVDGDANVPDAHLDDVTHKPVMFTSDLALRTDPAYEAISRRFHENPDQFADAFARAWYKLTHRDMGPIARYVGALVPDEELIWTDPVTPTGVELTDADIAELKAQTLAAGVEPVALVKAAWASAATFRKTDKRGGANGARVRLAPQNGWAANDPAELSSVLTALESVQAGFGKEVSLADLIVIGGSAAIEAAAKAAGHDITVPVLAGRGDATEAQTDAESFAVLEPTHDGFRNYLDADHTRPAEALLIDKAILLGLSAPEMTVLVGGLRALGANTGGSDVGVLTRRAGQLTNDFFVNLLDMGTTWSAADDAASTFTGTDRDTGEQKWTASRVDLVFGSHSQLRALAEVYAGDDAAAKFVTDFVAAWTKVMNADRFDV